MVDVAFYNEISTVFFLDKYAMRKGDNPHLYKWLKRMGEHKEVAQADDQLLAALQKVGLD